MDATTASLIGASIGALAGLGGGWLNGWRQSKIEHQKWVRARYDAIEKDARLALADLTKKLAAGVHAICWLSWKAKYESEKLSERDLSAYDTSMQTLFPDIVGSRVILAALSKETHDLMSPLVLKLYAFDVRVAEGAASFRKSPADGIKALAACHDDCLQFDLVLLEEVTRIGLPKA